MKSEELNHLSPAPTEARRVLSPPKAGRGSLFIFLLLLTLGIRAQATFDYFYLEAEKCRLAEDYASAMDLSTT